MALYYFFSPVNACIQPHKKSYNSEYVKAKGAELSKSFIDILLSVSPVIHSDIKYNIDDLDDKITTKIIDAGFNLNDKPTFNREIGTLISYSHNYL